MKKALVLLVAVLALNVTATATVVDLKVDLLFDPANGTDVAEAGFVGAYRGDTLVTDGLTLSFGIQTLGRNYEQSSYQKLNGFLVPGKNVGTDVLGTIAGLPAGIYELTIYGAHDAYKAYSGDGKYGGLLITDNLSGAAAARLVDVPNTVFTGGDPTPAQLSDTFEVTLDGATDLVIGVPSGFMLPISAFELATVPEPATLGLLAAGAMAMVRRRK